MPDLDQLRHRAREAHRAALGGDARALAEAEELIAGQYADRPQLRPVLDAVLAAEAGRCTSGWLRAWSGTLAAGSVARGLWLA